MSDQLPHDPYIAAVIAALVTADLEPDSYWTSDAEIDPYATGDDAGCTTMLNAVIGWDDETDDDTGGLLLFWDHPAEQWQHARPRVEGGNTEPDFLPLNRWADPAAVVTAVRILLAELELPAGEDPRLWLHFVSANAAVEAWGSA